MSKLILIVIMEVICDDISMSELSFMANCFSIFFSFHSQSSSSGCFPVGVSYMKFAGPAS